MYIFEKLDLEFSQCNKLLVGSSNTVKTGTTIVAALAENGVVFGADTQSTFGPMKSDLSGDRGMSKVTKLTDKLAFSLCGQASAIAILTSYFKKFIAIYMRETGEVVTPNILAKNLRYQLQKQPVDSFAILIFGWNQVLNKPQLFGLWGDGFLEESAVLALGSGMPYALGHILPQYAKVTNKTIDSIKLIVKDTVRTAVQTDLYSGFCIDIGAISATTFEINRYPVVTPL